MHFLGGVGSADLQVPYSHPLAAVGVCSVPQELESEQIFGKLPASTIDAFSLVK